MTSLVYDLGGRLSGRVDPSGVHYGYFYDVNDNLTQTQTDYGTIVENAIYDAYGRRTSVFDSQGIQTDYGYNADGQRVSESKDGSATLYRYDDWGRLEELEDPNGNVTSWEYNNRSQVIQETGPLGDARTFAYDSLGHLRLKQDRDGRVTTWQNDAWGLPTSEIWTYGGQTVNSLDYNYDALGRLIRAEDDNTVVERNFNAWGELVSEWTTVDGFQSPSRFDYDYDSLGQLEQRQLVLGAVSNPAALVDQFGYDDWGQVQTIDRTTERSGGGGLSVGFAYDAVGRMTTIDRDVIDGLGGVHGVGQTSLAYDSAGRMDTLTHTRGPQTLNALQYTYGNATTQLDSVTSSVDGTQQFSYDLAGQLTGVTSPIAGQAFTRQYDSNGNATAGALGTAAIGPDNRLLRDTEFSYSYDLEGHRTRREARSNYPAALGGALLNGASGFAGENNAGLGSMGENASQDPSSGGSSFGGSSFGSSGFGSSSFGTSGFGSSGWGSSGWGSSGFSVSSSVSSQGSSSWVDTGPNGTYETYSWDHRGRLTEVTTWLYDQRSEENPEVTASDVKHVEYTYDAFNRRVAQTVTERDFGSEGSMGSSGGYSYSGSKSTTGSSAGSESEWSVILDERYILDGDHVLAVANRDGEVVEQILHGPMIDQVLAEEHFDASSGQRDYVDLTFGDHLGTITEVVRWDDATDTIIGQNHLVYNAFGELLTESDEDLTPRFRYTGREFDDEAGHQFNRARYFDVGTSRWLSQDPIGFTAGDANLYRYVGNGATMKVDPTGLVDVIGQESPRWHSDSGWDYVNPISYLGWIGEPVGRLATRPFTIRIFIDNYHKDRALAKSNKLNGMMEGNIQEYCNSMRLPDSHQTAAEGLATLNYEVMAAVPTLAVPVGALSRQSSQPVLARAQYVEDLDSLGTKVATSKRSQQGVVEPHMYVNLGHHVPGRTAPGSRPYIRGKSVLPSNHVELFQESVVVVNPDNGDLVRWAREGTGKKANYHRFEPHLPGAYHWSGSTCGVDDRDISRALTKGSDAPVKEIDKLLTPPAPWWKLW